MQKLLEINNISKTFNTLNGEINAIKSISFDVNNEDFIAIVGSSGCGKSTLLNIISVGKLKVSIIIVPFRIPSLFQGT